MSLKEDKIVFVAETPVVGNDARMLPWQILVVDDDLDVHEATRFVLRSLRVFGRSLQLTHASSGKEAMAILTECREFAVILLDVVMESENAGLQLVDTIRNDLCMTNTRIILRTGQPGQVPEVETIIRYDINDYRTKSELTQDRLHASLAIAIRNYNQLTRSDKMNELARAELEDHAAKLQKTNQDLNVLSVTDRLTQIYNRVKLDDVITHGISQAKRYPQDLSLIMLDIDHFKLINDAHGHQVGDTVLVKVAEVLRKSIRETDTVGRWGGEEFMIVLPQTGPDKAFDVADKIRNSIASMEHHVTGRLTASFGVTSFISGDNEILMLERVDSALYEAKAGGRNKVVLKNSGSKRE